MFYAPNTTQAAVAFKKIFKIDVVLCFSTTQLKNNTTHSTQAVAANSTDKQKRKHVYGVGKQQEEEKKKIRSSMKRKKWHNKHKLRLVVIFFLFLLASFSSLLLLPIPVSKQHNNIKKKNFSIYTQLKLYCIQSASEDIGVRGYFVGVYSIKRSLMMMPMLFACCCCCYFRLCMDFKSKIAGK